MKYYLLLLPTLGSSVSRVGSFVGALMVFFHQMFVPYQLIDSVTGLPFRNIGVVQGMISAFPGQIMEAMKGEKGRTAQISTASTRFMHLVYEELGVGLMAVDCAVSDEPLHRAYRRLPGMKLKRTVFKSCKTNPKNFRLQSQRRVARQCAFLGLE
jgi:hypothetical protein